MGQEDPHSTSPLQRTSSTKEYQLHQYSPCQVEEQVGEPHIKGEEEAAEAVVLVEGTTRNQVKSL